MFTSALLWRRRWTPAIAWSPRSTIQHAPGPLRTPSALAEPTCASTEWKAQEAISLWAARCRCGIRFTPHGNFLQARHGCSAFSISYRFYPVSAQELIEIREAFPRGRYPLRIEPREFRLREYHAFLQSIKPEAEAFKRHQQAAFEAERERWAAAGQAEYIEQPEATARSGG